MKRIKLTLLILLAFVGISINVNAQCDFSITLMYNYWKGWDGGTVSVMVNGEVVLSKLTLEDEGPVSYTFSANTGDDITTEYVEGEYAYLAYYNIATFEGTILNEQGGTVENNSGGTPKSIKTGTLIAKCPTCFIPTAVQVRNITTNSVDLACTNTEVNWNVEYGIYGFAKGTGTVIAGTKGELFNLTGLNSSSDYQYYAQSNCGYEDLSVWIGPFTFNTECEIISSFPYNQDFDGGWPCWSTVNAKNGWYKGNFRMEGKSGKYYANCRGDDNYLISPQFTLEDNAELKWFDKTEYYKEHKNIYDVLLSTTTNDIAAFTVNLGTVDCNNEFWMNNMIDLSKYSGQTIYIAFHSTLSDRDNYAFGIDDFSIGNLSKSSNAYLSDLKADGKIVTRINYYGELELFTPTTKSYDMVLAYGTTKVPKLTYTTYDKKATAVVTDATTLPGYAKVVVTAENGTRITYNINFSVSSTKSKNADLTGLTVNDVSVTDFKKDTYEYDVELSFGTTEIPIIGYTFADETATATVTSPTTVKGTYLVTVTAQDGTTTKSYRINVTVRSTASKNADLSDLIIDGEKYKYFNASTTTTEIELPYGTTDVPKVTFKLDDETAVGILTETTSVPGETKIVVTAQNGTTVKTYIVKFTLVPASDNAYLFDLTVDESTVLGFNLVTIVYNVRLPYGTTDVPKVDYVIYDAERATAVLNAAVKLPGTTTVVVTAQDGTLKTYTINFTVASTISSNADLKYIIVNGKMVPNFDASKTTYDVKLPYLTTALPVVSYALDDVASTSVLTEATELLGAATVVVTAQDGTLKTYTINFTVAGPPSTNASLSDLQVNEIAVANFDAATFSYDVVLSFGTIEMPKVTYTTSDAAATVKVLDVSELPGLTTVKVTAEDKKTLKTYTINFTIATALSNANLSDLKVDGTTIDNFNVTTISYNVELPKETTVVPKLTYTIDAATATAVLAEATVLPGASTVVVTAQDGTLKTYTVNFSVFSGIRDVDLNAEISVSPNPNNGLFNVIVLLPSKNDVTLQLINITGKIVREYKYDNVLELNKTIDVTELSKGMYFLKINVGYQVKVEKVIVR